jgi:hypothetical protein
MISVTDGPMSETQQEPAPMSANETDAGLVKLGAVSETQGGLVGYFSDTGNGFTFLF